MAEKLDGKLVIGISSRALFDLSYENNIYETQGLEAYTKYQVEHESEILKPGSGFYLVQSLLKLNEYEETKDMVEVIIMSRNNADTSVRIQKSIEHYELNIKRAVFTSGAKLADYLEAFQIDLFLSAYEEDVQAAIDANYAAGLIYSEDYVPYDVYSDQIRIAFDGDAVLFDPASERIYKENGLEAFEENERKNADNAMGEGPFASFLKSLAAIQSRFNPNDCPIRTALVTARGAQTQERVIKTLRQWNVRVDEAFFLSGLKKQGILQAFKADIFFDDQVTHLDPASKSVPAFQVPYKK